MANLGHIISFPIVLTSEMESAISLAQRIPGIIIIAETHFAGATQPCRFGMFVIALAIAFTTISKGSHAVRAASVVESIERDDGLETYRDLLFERLPHERKLPSVVPTGESEPTGCLNERRRTRFEERSVVVKPKAFALRLTAQRAEFRRHCVRTENDLALPMHGMHLILRI